MNAFTTGRRSPATTSEFRLVSWEPTTSHRSLLGYAEVELPGELGLMRVPQDFARSVYEAAGARNRVQQIDGRSSLVEMIDWLVR